MNAKRVFIGALGLLAILVVVFAAVEVQELPDQRKEMVLRFIDLWNAGEEEEALTLFDPRVLSERSKVANALQELRKTFGPLTLKADAHEPPPFWPHRIGHVEKLSFVSRTFAIEFSSGPKLRLAVLFLTDQSSAGKIGQFEFQFQPGDSAYGKFGELCRGLGP